ncbi:unnamed protein product [Haemonchus placei]|uniref:Uncharacterized protein n=1 Tax=Haemonchus placei TaxID=6290 RepID=A0A0N4WK42_HAEPC|nr:unnamed protein product [Haemonchus placei]
MGLWLDAAASDQKRRCRPRGPSSAEDERAAPAMVRECTKKTLEPFNKGGNGVMESEGQGKRSLEASKKRWRDVIKMDLAEAEVTSKDVVNRKKDS